MIEWQPIETAPKDGREFLTYSPPVDGLDSRRHYDVAHWSDEWNTFCKAMCGFRFVTHWAPLNPPGKAK